MCLQNIFVVAKLAAEHDEVLGPARSRDELPGAILVNPIAPQRRELLLRLAERFGELRKPGQ